MSHPTDTTASPSPKTKTHQPSGFTVKKGKWYDSLRPVPGYQGFGGLGVDSSSSSKGEEMTKEEREAHAKLQDYSTKVPRFGFHKAKADEGRQ